MTAQSTVMERDLRITGSLRGQSSNHQAPKGFEVSHPWKVRKTFVNISSGSNADDIPGRETDLLGQESQCCFPLFSPALCPPYLLYISTASTFRHETPAVPYHFHIIPLPRNPYLSSEANPRIPRISLSRRCISKYLARASIRSSSECSTCKTSVCPRTLRLTSLSTIMYCPITSVPL